MGKPAATYTVESSRHSREMETLLDVERDHGPVVDARVLVAQSQHEETEQHRREDLHLPVCELLSQADPRTGLHADHEAGVDSWKKNSSQLQLVYFRAHFSGSDKNIGMQFFL